MPDPEEEPRVKWSKGQSPGTTQRAHRNPMSSNESDGSPAADTAKTPAFTPLPQGPPRSNAPGSPPRLPSPPKQLKSPPGKPAAAVQSVQRAVKRSAQSATHSVTLPI